MREGEQGVANTLPLFLPSSFAFGVGLWRRFLGASGSPTAALLAAVSSVSKRGNPAVIALLLLTELFIGLLMLLPLVIDLLIEVRAALS
jgi:hypothetical protein